MEHFYKAWKKRSPRLFLVLAAALSMAACAAPNPPAPLQEPRTAAHSNTLTGFTGKETAQEPAGDISALRAGDKIRVTVFGDTDLTDEYDVDTNGFITMPLVGEIKADGASEQSLADDIEEKLGNGYLVNPRVSVNLISLRPFYISGEVRTPGSYPAVASLDAFKAIAIAGGLTPRAVKNNYVIMRGEGPARQHINANDDTPVFPGDAIKVKERFF